MSSVVIAGDTSGTITLQAPAVSGTTTLNLPTLSGGTLVTTDSGGTVLIGTTTNSTSSATKLEAFGTDAGIICHYSGQSRGGLAALTTQRIALTTTVSNDNIVFGYNTTSTTFVEHMRVNNSNGAVTTPFQPSFTGWRTAGNVSSTNVVLHNNIITNVGSYYNSATGRFTCPVAGKYLVICDGHAENAQPSEHAIYKNGSAVCYAYQNGAAYGRASQSAILDCATNDYIQQYVTNGAFWGGNNSGIKMTITLIG